MCNGLEDRREGGGGGVCTGLRSRCDYCVGAGGTKKKGGGCVRVSGRGEWCV